MALLLILFSLLSFVFLGIGSGRSGERDLTPGSSSSSRSCSTATTTLNGTTVRKQSCSSTSSAKAVVRSRAVVRCSARMTADGHVRTRCSPASKP